MDNRGRNVTLFHTSNQFKVTNEKNSFLKNGAGKLDIQTQKYEAGPLTPITHTQKKTPEKNKLLRMERNWKLCALLVGI